MNNISTRQNLIYILFPIIFGYIFLLVYSPIKVDDEQLLIITMVFTSFIVSIPLFSFIELDIKEPLSTEKTKSKQKDKENPKNEKTKNNSFTSEENKWYNILESSPDSTDVQIKSNFRRLAKKYHPDIIQVATFK